MAAPPSAANNMVPKVNMTVPMTVPVIPQSIPASIPGGITGGASLPGASLSIVPDPNALAHPLAPLPPPTQPIRSAPLANSLEAWNAKGGFTPAKIAPPPPAQPNTTSTVPKTMPLQVPSIPGVPQIPLAGMTGLSPAGLTVPPLAGMANPNQVPMAGQVPMVPQIPLAGVGVPLATMPPMPSVPQAPQVPQVPMVPQVPQVPMAVPLAGAPPQVPMAVSMAVPMAQAGMVPLAAMAVPGVPAATMGVPLAGTPAHPNPTSAALNPNNIDYNGFTITNGVPMQNGVPIPLPQVSQVSQVLQPPLAALAAPNVNQHQQIPGGYHHDIDPLQIPPKIPKNKMIHPPVSCVQVNRDYVAVGIHRSLKSGYKAVNPMGKDNSSNIRVVLNKNMLRYEHFWYTNNAEGLALQAAHKAEYIRTYAQKTQEQRIKDDKKRKREENMTEGQKKRTAIAVVQCHPETGRILGRFDSLKKAVEHVKPESNDNGSNIKKALNKGTQRYAHLWYTDDATGHSLLAEKKRELNGDTDVTVHVGGRNRNVVQRRADSFDNGFDFDDEPARIPISGLRVPAPPPVPQMLAAPPTLVAAGVVGGVGAGAPLGAGQGLGVPPVPAVPVPPSVPQRVDGGGDRERGEGKTGEVLDL